jgi:hypothetical protein
VRFHVFIQIAAMGLLAVSGSAAVTFHKDFEGGSFARVEQVASNHFRCHVEGQTDERGRNRQATWYSFRIDGAQGRELVISLTNFVGEYNDKPGAVSMNAQTIPVFSRDGKQWQHFPKMEWNDTAKEATVRFRVETPQFWIAHVPPYTVSRLNGLIDYIARIPNVRVSVIGKTLEGRDLQTVTVTDSKEPERAKKVIWLVARQHAWEAGTSFVMEGALNFITSNDPRAVSLRKRVVFNFVPMMAQDGVVHGKVRFNMNGYDINRHWNETNWLGDSFRKQMPEIWAVKKALFASLDDGSKTDLLLNLHNTETGEYLRSQTDDLAVQNLLQRLEVNLMAKTSYDPGTRLSFSKEKVNDTNSLWHQRRVPVALMEQRISSSKKLGRQPTMEDRLQFGRDLIVVMAETVLGDK